MQFVCSSFSTFSVLLTLSIICWTFSWLVSTLGGSTCRHLATCWIIRWLTSTLTCRNGVARTFRRSTLDLGPGEFVTTQRRSVAKNVGRFHFLEAISSVCLRTTDRPWNGRGPDHVIHFRIFTPPEISLEWLKIESSNFVHVLAREVLV